MSEQLFETASGVAVARFKGTLYEGSRQWIQVDGFDGRYAQMPLSDFAEILARAERLEELKPAIAAARLELAKAEEREKERRSERP